MVCDTLLIGSGLSALGAAMALRERGERVLCLTGDAQAQLRTYPGTAVPLEFTGPGGLGSYWHGVIPLSLASGFAGLDRASFTRLLRRFYPGAPTSWIGRDRLLIPLRPIRPLRELVRTAASDPALELRGALVERIELLGDGVAVHVAGDVIWARQAILAAGALGTPRLLQQSGLIETRERRVSDHLIGYAGRVARNAVKEQLARPVLRSEAGMAIPCQYSADRTVLYTLRPARFDLAALDAGIETRALFGLPTSRIVAGLAGRVSPGLIAEAFYNRFGVGRKARWQSVNIMAEAPDIYRLSAAGSLIMPNADTVTNVIRAAVRACPLAGMETTRRPDLFIPGIHLHGTLDAEERCRFDPAGKQAIKVIDSSRLTGIGAEHHSFKMLVAAYKALRGTA